VEEGRIFEVEEDMTDIEVEKGFFRKAGKG
jgi:hypothetical protein